MPLRGGAGHGIKDPGSDELIAGDGLIRPRAPGYCGQASHDGRAPGEEVEVRRAGRRVVRASRATSGASADSGHRSCGSQDGGLCGLWRMCGLALCAGVALRAGKRRSPGSYHHPAQGPG
jgi:hypothetical protein